MDIRIAGAGLIIGALVGATGMGGGSLTTPLLIFLGVPPVLSVGSDLAFSAITKWAGAVVHLSQRTVDLRLAGLLASGSVPASLVGVGVIRQLGPVADEVVPTALGATLVLVAVVLAAQGFVARSFRERAVVTESAPTRGRRRSAAVIATGAVIGLLVGMTSVGSGTLVVASLLLLYPALPISSAVGTDILQAAVLTSASGLAYLWMGQVEGRLVVSLLAGSLPGVLIGSKFSGRAPEKVLRLAVALMLAVAGLRLL